MSHQKKYELKHHVTYVSHKFHQMNLNVMAIKKKNRGGTVRTSVVQKSTNKISTISVNLPPKNFHHKRKKIVKSLMYHACKKQVIIHLLPRSNCAATAAPNVAFSFKHFQFISLILNATWISEIQ